MEMLQIMVVKHQQTRFEIRKRTKKSLIVICTQITLTRQPERIYDSFCSTKNSNAVNLTLVSKNKKNCINNEY